MSEDRARYGWESDFPGFQSAQPRTIRDRLSAFVRDASEQQRRAWAEGIPPLQHEIREILASDALANHYSTILEYELPMEGRRPDVILLVKEGILVLELKGKAEPSQADLDQVAAYARDLRCYHRDCAEWPVIPVLVPTRAKGYLREEAGVHIVGPDALDTLVGSLAKSSRTSTLDRQRFLEETAYRPLPTLVKAARELFTTGELRRIHRAHAATKPTVDLISEIVHEAARTSTRHLILITGIPGAGKTLVGLQVVHAHYLDDLAVTREGVKPTAPAVFLSGNGPLVDVLQYELKEAGGGGRTFVRSVKKYVERYSRSLSLVPPEHVLVFDEAQRAHDAERVKEVHKNSDNSKSEPEHFVDFAERVPKWCVVVGLIGSGQEIHVGEEGGIIQWRRAVEHSTQRTNWTVHIPPQFQEAFSGAAVPVSARAALNLDVELRFHLASKLHEFVAGLLGEMDVSTLRMIADNLESDGYHLRITRDLEIAKNYLWERYSDAPDARFGLMASSRDRSLTRFGVANDFHATKRVRYGPWYGDGQDSYSGQSCRLLESCVTEFGAQGLELDAALLAWGTDYRRVAGSWSAKDASRYRNANAVRDAFRLRMNAYRVLLTRGRDACVVFIPPLTELDETFERLIHAGFKHLDRHNGTPE